MSMAMLDVGIASSIGGHYAEKEKSQDRNNDTT
jgi:hypothetical protein